MDHRDIAGAGIRDTSDVVPAGNALTGEAFQVASTLARTGRFADAFGLGTGLTAHLPPTGLRSPVRSIMCSGRYAAGEPDPVSYAIILVVTSYALGQILFALLRREQCCPYVAVGTLISVSPPSTSDGKLVEFSLDLSNSRNVPSGAMDAWSIVDVSSEVA